MLLSRNWNEETLHGCCNHAEVGTHELLIMKAPHRPHAFPEWPFQRNGGTTAVGSSGIGLSLQHGRLQANSQVKEAVHRLKGRTENTLPDKSSPQRQKQTVASVVWVLL